MNSINASPHLPSAVTDLKGAKPKGPGPVAHLDPFRVVATIDGNQITAKRALQLINGTTLTTRIEFGTTWPVVLQKAYMRLSISTEALKMHLDRQEPWKDQLQHEAVLDLEKNEYTFGADPNTLLLHDVRDRIMWKAYFNQPASEAERQQLMRRELERYKITVLDPDFFVGSATP